ncbi:Methyltransferase type 12 [Methanocorpusculum labreanum Z]|uniref:Methyltransferase type 12 n=1 Tax=Methanocorpusculum labreanum (strain ATCC 43576 / DSM 4855 / Z) TaxID=410358 RepID=A2SQ96_METLZ|nr:class I SAM-dependent methyltransferase [Methanocorpusculum labreanum]ABN06502.1 Methyltransferase type 12 [Methanocorpusculum labreanum Z]
MNDANAEWNENYHLQEIKPRFKSSAQHFQEKENAENMVKRLIEHPSPHIQDQLQSLAFPPGSTVLDIGAGPGTLAVPLTKEGHIVTVVEPSKAMKDAMEQYKQYCGVKADIPRIEKLWENVDPAEIGTYDYVISSFALGVPDLKKALMKMNAVANKEVHIFWFLNPQSWSQIKKDLYTLLYQEDYPDWMSYANVVWQALYQENIYANLTVHARTDKDRYKNIDEVVSMYVRQFSVTDEIQRNIIENYLNEHLTMQNDGWYTLPNNGKYAHIWWKKE